LFAFIQQLSLNPFKPDAFLIRGLGWDWFHLVCRLQSIRWDKIYQEKPKYSEKISVSFCALGMHVIWAEIELGPPWLGTSD
jgi:hypothetical protein